MISKLVKTALGPVYDKQMTNILNFLAKTALGLSDEAFYIILVKNHPNAAFLMQIPLKSCRKRLAYVCIKTMTKALQGGV
jgi:hypothetical protein